MSKNTIQKWINAAKILSNDKDAKVICPECEESYLLVKDAYDIERKMMYERIMHCENCDAVNYIRMIRKK